MVFSSYLFLFYFLPIVLGLYFASPPRTRQMLLAGMSYIFYGWANPWFVFLMLSSTAIDYWCGLVLSGRRSIPGQQSNRARERKLAVAISVAGNLSLLGFFKYFGFLQENLNLLLEAFGYQAMEVFRVVLPLGISFYTFQSMSYSLDLYRKAAQPARNFLDFACYVSLFPQLVAGPIVRYSDIAQQLSSRTHTLDKFVRGITFFVLGLSKKVLLANPMGEVADAAFGAGDLMWHQGWAGVLAYAFQIYFDFSGYSDMAIGLGLMLGFTFPRNFNSPYKADSITDFWRRWHISLSSWLRDYLYIPLGGNRKGELRTYVNLMTVMLLGGLWHGASWNFVIWGAIHGFMLCGERILGKKAFYAGLPRAVRVAFTFCTVLITWVFFRAPDLSSALAYLGSMFGMGGQTSGSLLALSSVSNNYHIMIFCLCAFLIWACRNSWSHSFSVGPAKALVMAGLLAAAVGVLLTQAFNPFIYFIF